MDIFEAVHRRVCDVLNEMAAAGRLPSLGDYLTARGRTPLEMGDVFSCEPPRNPKHGDVAVNAALVFCKIADGEDANPRFLAKTIADRLIDSPMISNAEVAGPGFINVTIQHALLTSILSDARNREGGFAPTKEAPQRDVNLEFVSANPTGPLHVGHARGAVFGDALANLLRFTGHNIVREYYINDAGAQVDKLAHSVYGRYLEALGAPHDSDFEYPGDYLIPVGRAMAAHYGQGMVGRHQDIWLPYVRDVAVKAMMAAVREDLDGLGIRHDVFFHERCLVYDGAQAPAGVMRLRASKVENAVQETIRHLRENDLVYEGTLDAPVNGPEESGASETLTLFRASNFGDVSDRAILRQDGSATYFANDLAYHRDKIERGFKTLINVWGADHSGYISRMQSGVKALSGGLIDLEVLTVQMVHLKGVKGRILTMSKRSGSYVTLGDLLDLVGRDAVRFMMLFRKNNDQMVFDVEMVTKQSKENPVYYVQYAHARTQSLLEKARGLIPVIDILGEQDALDGAEHELLVDQDEIFLMRKIAEFPRMVKRAAEAREPHRVAFYLHDLAGLYHAYWARGRGTNKLLFIDPHNIPLSLARLALSQGVGSVIRTGLGLLGVSAPNAMAHEEQELAVA